MVVAMPRHMGTFVASFVEMKFVLQEVTTGLKLCSLNEYKQYMKLYNQKKLKEAGVGLLVNYIRNFTVL